MGPSHRKTEYFLLEVRRPAGWDQGLEGLEDSFADFDGGVLILHLDEEVGTPSANDFNKYVKGKHQGNMVKEADGPHLTKDAESDGTKDTLWYQGNPNYEGDGTFSATSSPNSNFHDGTASGFSLREFSASGAVMTRHDGEDLRPRPHRHAGAGPRGDGGSSPHLSHAGAPGGASRRRRAESLGGTLRPRGDRGNLRGRRRGHLRSRGHRQRGHRRVRHPRRHPHPRPGVRDPPGGRRRLPVDLLRAGSRFPGLGHAGERLGPPGHSPRIRHAHLRH
ncbi:MAG: hypothetical protein BWY88_01477 [Synergistetes bacterium ADurb.Bin520]|nr:MAG: hypothetical protein BWY88_01477 [Synergistetes bacterium ADurb.Bin520]